MEEKNQIDEKMKVEEDRKIQGKVVKTRKIGRFTFGLVLICVGIAILLITVTNIDMVRYITMLSPLIFISLGLEVILLSKKNEIKYDLIGIILTFITLGSGWILAGVNYAINGILYNKEVQQAILEQRNEEDFMYYFDDQVNLMNMGNQEIHLKITESQNVQNTRVYVKYQYDYDEEIEGKHLISTLIHLERNQARKVVDYQKNSILFVDCDENCKKIEVNVITDKKDQIKTEGNFVIEESSM